VFAARGIRLPFSIVLLLWIEGQLEVGKKVLELFRYIYQFLVSRDL
jgi:hypothetical protein